MAKLELTRRQFLAGLGAALLVAVSSPAAYARLVEPYNYRVSETDVFIRELPANFEDQDESQF